MSSPAKVPWKFSATAVVLAYTRGHNNKIIIKDLDFSDFTHTNVREAVARLTNWGMLQRIKPGVYVLQ